MSKENWKPFWTAPKDGTRIIAVTSLGPPYYPEIIRVAWSTRHVAWVDGSMCSYYEEFLLQWHDDINVPLVSENGGRNRWEWLERE